MSFGFVIIITVGTERIELTPMEILASAEVAVSRQFQQVWSLKWEAETL